MKERIFPFIIALSALSVSASAAFYSVYGLSKLFAGATTEVIIMAGALEFAKLVCASLLYQYWNVINKLLRTYFIVATFILVVITSGGIYGFLSGAFEETNTQSEFLDRQVTILESKKTIFEEKKEDLTLEKTAVVKSISDLRISLSNPTSVSYYSEEAGQVITTTSSSTRRALQKELNTAIEERNNISLQINATTDSIAAYDIKILDQQIGNESARELGPLKYMAELTGKPMEQIVNWFMLLIIFVFDPLAIAMVVAANMAFAQIKKPKIEKFECDIPEGLEYNKPYTIKEIKKKLPKSEDPKEKVIIKEVPVEKIVIKEVPVEKIVEKIVEVEKKEELKDYEVYKKLPKDLKGPVKEAVKHARRAGKNIPNNIDGFFED